MKKIAKFSAILLVLFFGGCKKKTVDPENLSKTEMVSRTWVCDQAELVSGTKTVIYKKGSGGNILELKDSFIKFNADGTYTGVDFNTNPQTGSWLFKNNETIAELDAWDYDFVLVNLTKKNLDFNTQVDYNDKTYDIFVKMIPK